MSVWNHVEPREVFRFFEDLSAIPRGSGHTKAASDWCVTFAQTHGLAHVQDPAGNVMIFAPGSTGCENVEPLILQGHLDMVCEKDADCPTDMEREGIRLVVDGDLIRAEGTTLGADDGIAVAMAFAVLDNPALEHPPLEIVLTVDEEIGMLGAACLDLSPLRGRRLLNLDSETEGVFTVGCAGGCTARCTLPVIRSQTSDSKALRISVSGLTGGHSGVEIHHGRANANMELARMLGKLPGIRLGTIGGGQKDNAIPVSAEAVVFTDVPDKIQQAVETMSAELRQQFQRTDPGLTVTIRPEQPDIPPEQPDLFPMDAASTKRVLDFLTRVPNGVQSMSGDIPGLVQTSLNLGILRTQSDTVTAAFCIRSSVTDEKNNLLRQLRDLITSIYPETSASSDISGDMTYHDMMSVVGDYPAWEYRVDSPLHQLCDDVFREQYGYAPKMEIIHAGVECGLLCGKRPELDCLSLGPNLYDVHTPRERMSIASVQRVWAFLTELLRRAAHIDGNRSAENISPSHYHNEPSGQNV